MTERHKLIEENERKKAETQKRIEENERKIEAKRRMKESQKRLEKAEKRLKELLINELLFLLIIMTKFGKKIVYLL
jgi:hypothetical protein